MELTDERLWVFGYGSLMWRPGFSYLDVQPATVHGYHRAFCILSWDYRGTRERPGLVFGLDRGGSCVGRAFRVAPEQAENVRDYLYEREMDDGVYRQVTCRVALGDGQRVPALAHAVNHDNPRYARKLSHERMVELVLQGTGKAGPCREYLANTVHHLDEMGIGDGPLHRLQAMVRLAIAAENS